MKKNVGNVALKQFRYVLGAIVLMLGISVASDMKVYGDYSYTDEQGVKYALSTSDGNVAAVYSYEGTVTVPVIPECVTVNDVTYKVIGVGSMRDLSVAKQYPDLANQVYYANAFRDCETITTVTYEKPENIEYIGSGAFHWCFGLTGEAPIPSGCKYIGAAAFELCRGLQSMEIPEGALEVGTQAFYSCNSISENSIPSSLTSIGERAFYGCSSMTGTFTLPSAITEIPDEMMKGCSSFTGLVLHDKVTKIGKNAFANWASLEGTFTVPPLVTEIPDGMLSVDVLNKYNNTTLTKIVLHDDITEIGAGAFRGLQGLESVTIPPLVTEIKNYTFEDCYNLTSIEIHDNVTSFGKGAFSNCVDLTGTMTVPEEMTEIPAELFAGCRSLTSIVLPENVTAIGAEAFSGCKKWATEISLEGITSIGNGAFKSCELLTGIPVIPDEITQIPDSAFYGCISLNGELVIPGNVKSIGLSAFAGCTGITSLVLEDGIETIGKQAFLSCDGLKFSVIYIPESVSSVGALAFRGGDYTREWLFNATIFYPYGKYYEGYDKTVGIVSYKEQEDGTLALYLDRRFMECGTLGYNYVDPLEIPEKIYGKTVSSLTIPDFDWPDWFDEYDYYFVVDEFNVVDETCYFNDWDQIAVGSHGRNCTICGEADTEVHSYPNGTSACSGCGHIPFTLMSSLSQKAMQTGYASGPVCSVKAVCKLAGENLSYQWYENNTAITGATALSYTVPTGKTAGTYTYTCKVSNGDYSAISTGVTFTVYKPEVVDGITLVDASLETPKVGDYVKSSDGTSIYKVSAADGKYEVEYSRPANKNLTAVVIPDTVTIGGIKYNVTSIAANAFKNCKKLKTLKIGKNVKKIGAKAFYNCTSLTKVTGGKSLLTIGKSAFQGCKKLKTVSISSKKLKTIGAKAFYGCKKLVKITLKTTKLTKKSVGKNALKGTNKKLVIKVPKKKVSAYKKFFKTKGNKKVTVKK